jgi:signal transduction histidine kinase
LRTQLEVIQQDPNATLSDYREMGATLIVMLDRLDRLTEDLLLLAKGEKQITREPVNLEVLLTEVIHELTPLAQASQVGLRLQMTEEIVFPADSRLLSRAVSNLVENGIRYNHPGGTVTVQADFQGNRLAIRVEDTGIGITESDLALIFERFYRVDRARDRNRGGSGLGLAISDHIVQLHGGEIRVSSTPGEGSSFTLWLPVKTP